MNVVDFVKRDTCRACGYGDLHLVLDLGEQPLANGFRKPDDESPETKYPLAMLRCPACELVQLSVVVDPEVMYGRDYPYRSGYSQGWDAHCHDLAREIGKRKQVLEIGCLDGVMLRHCRDNGCDVQGVDPSSPVTDLPIIREFWGPGIRLAPTYDTIIAQNVFGHVDDVKGFLLTCREHLHFSGSIIIECPWISDLVDVVRWDTIYHEHLSYWGVRPMMRLANTVGLNVNRVRHYPDLHGGTLRYYLSARKDVDPAVYALWREEEITSLEWREFRRRVSQRVQQWDDWFQYSDHKAIAAYGASAKLNVFLNALSTKPDLECVFDDNPEKVGLVTPGWHIPVKTPSREAMEHLDVLLVGSPNWKVEIHQAATQRGFTGEVRSLWP